MEVPVQERRRIARRAILLVSATAAIAWGLVAALLVLGHTRLALGILAGHTLALVNGVTWLLGAVATFDGPFTRFARATIGVAPLRLLVVVVGVVWLTWSAGAWVDPVALGLSFVASQLVLQIAQADCFMALASAASPFKRPARPVRFFGARFW